MLTKSPYNNVPVRLCLYDKGKILDYRKSKGDTQWASNYDVYIEFGQDDMNHPHIPFSSVGNCNVCRKSILTNNFSLMHGMFCYCSDECFSQRDKYGLSCFDLVQVDKTNDPEKFGHGTYGIFLYVDRYSDSGSLGYGLFSEGIWTGCNPKKYVPINEQTHEEVVKNLAIQTNGIFYKPGENYTAFPTWYRLNNLKLIKKWRNDKMINKVIVELFEKTSDAVLVAKHLMGQIKDDDITRILLKDKKEEILTLAKKMEAEEQAKKK